ncbi:SecDF P1 head subdomain-containing protein [Kitasatospora sp. NPDC094028]
MRIRYGVLLSGAAVLLAACSASDGGGDPAPSTPAVASTVPAGPAATATYTPRRVVTSTELERTAEKVKRRAVALGLADPKVEVGGNGTLTVTAAGGTKEKFTALAAQGQLGFRPVVALAPSGLVMPTGPGAADAVTGGAVPAALAAQFNALNCADAAQRAALTADPEAEVVACSAQKDLWEKLVLAPVVVDGQNLKSATVANDQQNGAGWQIQLTFDATGAAAFADITGKLAPQPTPTNEFAIVLDGRILSHPAVRSSITGGNAVISGSFTQDEAQQLAAQMSDRLEVGLTLTGTTAPS